MTSPPLAKKKQQQPGTCAVHFFVHFFDVVLHDYNVKLISYPDLTLYEINVKLYVGICRMCLPMFCRVPIHFFSTLPLIFSLLAALSHFLTANFCFSSNEISLVFFSNALALLSTSLKTLKFSRTWLCCWFFSLLSPDGLSLSKKSGCT